DESPDPASVRPDPVAASPNAPDPVATRPDARRQRGGIFFVRRHPISLSPRGARRSAEGDGEEKGGDEHVDDSNLVALVNEIIAKVAASAFLFCCCKAEPCIRL